MSINKELLTRLKAVLSSGEDIDDVLCKEENPEVMYHLSSIGEALLSWYEFKPESTLLEVNAQYGSLTGFFCNKISSVTSLQADSDAFDFINDRYKDLTNLELVCGDINKVCGRQFDYIALIGAEITPELISKATKLLKDDGVVIIGVNNPYSVRRWSGLEDSNGIAINTLKTLLESEGLVSQSVYYPYPDYMMPLQVFSPSRLPHADEITNHIQAFEDDKIVLHDEANIAYGLIKSGEYEGYVNSFLVFAGKTNNVNSNLAYFKQNFFRDPKYRLSTSIYKDEKLAVKAPLCDKASAHVTKMSKNRDLLDSLYSKVKVISCDFVSNGVSFPLVEGDTLLSDLDITNSSIEEVIDSVKNAMELIFDFKKPAIKFEMTDEFRSLFPECDVESDELSYEITNIDSNFDNFIVSKDGVWCIDYEWVVDFPVPISYVKFRNLLYFYTKHVAALSEMISENDFYKAFDIDTSRIDLYKKMDECFQFNVLGQNRKFIFVTNYEKKTSTYKEKIEEVLQSKTIEINRIAADYEAVIAQLRSDINKQNEHIENQRDSIDKLNIHINNQNDIINRQNASIEDLNQTIAKLFRAVKNPFYRVRYFYEEFKKSRNSGDKS